MGLIGLSPEDIEIANNTIQDKLEAYRVIYKAFWDAKQDAVKVSERFKLQQIDKVIKLTDLLEEQIWKQTCV